MRDIAAGLRLFGRAAARLARRPRLFAIGVAPALITMVLFGAGFVLLVLQLDELAHWLTPFAANWTAAARQSMQVLAGIAVLIAAGMVGIISYTAVTLLIGGPFYEHLSSTVENRLGAAPTSAEPGGWTLLVRGLRDSILLITASLGCAVPLLVAGFVPLLGQTVVPVLAVGAGSWLLALEVVGVPLQRRGLRLRDRHCARAGGEVHAWTPGVNQTLCGFALIRSRLGRYPHVDWDDIRSESGRHADVVRRVCPRCMAGSRPRRDVRRRRGQDARQPRRS